MRKTETAFPSEGYRRGTIDCANHLRSGEPVVVVSLSLGTPAGSMGAAESARFVDTVGTARDRGLSIVAAAGNHGGSSLDDQAAAPGVIAAAAGSTATGALCSFPGVWAGTWNTGALVAPGCGIDAGSQNAIIGIAAGIPFINDGGGSSAAAAHTSTIIAALRSLAPAKSMDDVENALKRTARTVDGHPVIDAAAAPRELGLGAVVDRAAARVPARPADPTPLAETKPGAGTAVVDPDHRPVPGGNSTEVTDNWTDYPKPRVKARLLSRRKGHDRLEIRVLNRPRDAGVIVLKPGERSDELGQAAKKSRVVFRTKRFRNARVMFASDNGTSRTTKITLKAKGSHRLLIR